VLRALHLVHQYPPALGGSETVVQKISEGLAGEIEIEVLTSASVHLEFLRARTALPTGRSREGGVTVDRRAPSPSSRPLHRALSAAAQAGVMARVPGAGRLRARALGPALPRVVADGVAFAPRIVLGAAAPFETLWDAERVARRCGAALALLPCLHHDPQVDHPSLLRLLRRADAVLTMTDHERFYLASLGVKRDRLHRIGGGVDPEAMTPAEMTNPAENGDASTRELRARHGLPADAPIVLFAGRQSEGKGLDLLIEAMARIWSAGAEARLVIAGAAAPGAVALRRGVDRLEPGHRGRVLFRDDVDEDEKRAWYRACAVMAAPSRVDSLGLCYLEAWSAGRPVIAARTGPQCELIDHEVDGLLVAPRGVEELARAIERMLAEPQRAREMGRRGRAKVLAEHTWDRVVARVREAYAAAIDEPLARREA
jgi:phosphatidylinositol alpha-1,6-mannosyltransferase